MPQPSLLDSVRPAIRLRHYSIRIEEAYVQVIRHFTLYRRERRPRRRALVRSQGARSPLERWQVAHYRHTK